MNKYERLKEFCKTERQIELIDALFKIDNVKKASKSIGMSERGAFRMLASIRKRQASVGKGEHFVADLHLENTGLGVKGTTTRLDRDKETGEMVIGAQYIKTDRTTEDRIEAMRGAISEIVEEVRGTEKKVKSPKIVNKDCMAVYNIGDAHIGMLAHRDESGDDFDLKIAESDLIGVMRRLVDSAPPSETAVIIDVGDFFHADNQSNETSGNKNKLDVDGRWHKVLKVGLNVMVELVREALKKHKKVIVKNIQGNHNEHSATFLAAYTAAKFENEPRVEVDELPSRFWYYQFGKVLIGSTHGHTVKPQDLGEIMACDCEDIWSSTRHRYWYTGHVHHDQVKEYRTYKFESFRTLAAKDAWHAGSGYRSGRDMKCIVHHKDYGEVQRHTVNLAMLRGDA